jgi:hypothetical protein
MAITRILNDTEKCELISALANARVNNAKKAKAFKGDSESAHHPEDKSVLFETAERFDMWAQLDEALIEAIRNNQIVILTDEDDAGNEEDGVNA